MAKSIPPETSSRPNAASCISPGISPHLHTTTEWHAIYVRHQHEIAVAHRLELLGFKVFLPLYREVRQWSDRRKQVNFPLFPCYVFFSGDPGVLNRRLAILNTPGVFSLVTCGGNLAVIPAAEFEPIVRVVASSAVVAPHPFLHAGDRVRVHKGPLAGIEGIVARIRDSRRDSGADSIRIVLSVHTLCQSIAFEVDGSVVEQVACAV